MLSPFWVVTFFFSMILLGLGQLMVICHTLISGLVAIRPDKLIEFESGTNELGPKCQGALSLSLRMFSLPALTFLTCVMGLILSFPLATEIAVFIVFFLDYVVGSAWWIIILYLLQMLAIFVVRGKPYSGENVIAAVFFPRKRVHCSAVLSTIVVFMWNVVRTLLEHSTQTAVKL